MYVPKVNVRLVLHAPRAHVNPSKANENSGVYIYLFSTFLIACAFFNLFSLLPSPLSPSFIPPLLSQWSFIVASSQGRFQTRDTMFQPCPESR